MWGVGSRMVVLAEGTPGGVFNGSRYLEGSARRRQG